MKTYDAVFFFTAVGHPPPIDLRPVLADMGFEIPVSLRSVMTHPHPPLLIAPADGSQHVPAHDLTLSWKDSGIPNYNQATAFRIILSPGDPNGSSIPQMAAPSTSCLVRYNLYFNFSYHWSVQAINDEGASGISQAGFSTIIGPSPTDLSPNNRDDIQVPVTLSWVDPGAEIGIPALEFEGMFFLDPSLGPSAPLTFNCQQPSFQVPANVSINTRYFWQVRSKYPPNDANN
jgi:hypothetical protein